MSIIERWSLKSAVEKTSDVFLFLFLPGFILVDIFTKKSEATYSIILADSLMTVVLAITFILVSYTALKEKILWKGILSVLLGIFLLMFLGA